MNAPAPARRDRLRAMLADTPWRRKKGLIVHGRAQHATRRALNRLARRRAREGPIRFHPPVLTEQQS